MKTSMLDLINKTLRVIEQSGGKHKEMAEKYTRLVCLKFCEDCEKNQNIRAFSAVTLIAKQWYYRHGQALEF